MQQQQQYISYASQVVQQPLPNFNHGKGKIYYLNLFPNQIPPPETMRTKTTTIFPFLFSDDETVEFWHNTCLGIGRKNILQLIGLAISNEDSNSVLIHTEKVNCSVFEWAKREQSLLNKHNSSNPTNQHSCALLTADHQLPSEAFGQVMRGILEGINQASSLNANAGNITSKSTFLVAGVAKVSLLTEKGKFVPPLPPLRQFSSMISALTAPLPSSELYWFIYFIDTNVYDQAFCEELPTHPSLYEMSTRLQFRCKVSKHLSALRVRNFTEYKTIEATFRRLERTIISHKRTLEPRGCHRQFKWKTHIDGFDQNSPYRQALTPPPPLVVNYSDYPFQFVRYCRNMAQHPGNLNEQDLESKFTHIWKEYIPCLHEALRLHNQLPKVYDKKDSI